MSKVKNYDVDARIESIKDSLIKIQNSFTVESQNQSSSSEYSISKSPLYSLSSQEESKKKAKDIIEKQEKNQENSKKKQAYEPHSPKNENSETFDEPLGRQLTFGKSKDPASSVWYTRSLEPTDIKAEDSEARPLKKSKDKSEIHINSEEIVEKLKQELAYKDLMLNGQTNELLIMQNKLKQQEINYFAKLKELQDTGNKNRERNINDDLLRQLQESETERERLETENQSLKEKKLTMEAEILMHQRKISKLKSKNKELLHKLKHHSSKNTPAQDNSIPKSPRKSPIKKHEESLLKGEVERLKSEILDIKQEVSKKQPKKGHQDAYKTAPITPTSHKSRPIFSPTKDGKFSPETDPMLRKILGQLMLLLKVDNVGDITQACQRLLRDSKSAFETNKFVKKITNLLSKYSQPNSLQSKPDLERVYKWIKRLIEEYLHVKKQCEAVLSHSAILHSIMKMLNVIFPEDLPGEIKKKLYI
ncbi:unnamed protein product [Blepharisma stoltei]|uniref:Uncharacterized protein n=1 Tax=Blepharisma stoltei TaxID=1481888 RepID=A0AAU9JB66_9CILI|nr:unnamed protein product [Blepharisma stoltei]